MFYRKTPDTKRRGGGSYAKGRKAIAIDQRTGFKHLQSEFVVEPGTGYIVHRDESDGRYSLVSHPQNYPPSKTTEKIGLRYPSPDVALSIGTVVSADQLSLPSHASTFYMETSTISVAPEVSVGTSGAAAIFSTGTNTQYVVLVFAGV